jgi:aldehyde dehydrogenase (NAD+)
MARIANSRHYERLTSLLASTKGKAVISGPSDASKLFISPTVVTDIKVTDPVLASEVLRLHLAILTYPTDRLASVLDNCRPD